MSLTAQRHMRRMLELGIVLKPVVQRLDIFIIRKSLFC